MKTKQWKTNRKQVLKFQRKQENKFKKMITDRLTFIRL